MSEVKLFYGRLGYPFKTDVGRINANEQINKYAKENNLRIQSVDYEEKGMNIEATVIFYEEPNKNHCCEMYELECLKTKKLQEENEVLRADVQRRLNVEVENIELKKQIEKMRCLKDVIIKAIREDNSDCVWEHAHNGKAKYIYAETVVDIINDKWEQK